MAKKLEIMKEPEKTIPEPVKEVSNNQSTDFSKLVDQAKNEITKAPTVRVRRTKAEIEASRAQPNQPVQAVNVAPPTILTPEQAEMRTRKISNILQAGTGALSQILIKTEHMQVEKKIADEWSKDLVDVAIAYPEFETYVSPKALAIAGLLGSTAIMVGGMVAVYKAHQELELKKLQSKNAQPSV